MAVGVIEKAEVVQVQQHDRERLPGLLGVLQRLMERLVERAVVEQARQRIPVRPRDGFVQQALPLPLKLASGRDVARDAERADDLAADQDRHLADADLDAFAVFAEDGDLIVLGDAVQGHLEHLPGAFLKLRGQQLPERHPQQLRDRVAAQRFASRVGADKAPIPVERVYGVPVLLEERSVPLPALPQPFFRRLSFRDFGAQLAVGLLQSGRALPDPVFQLVPDVLERLLGPLALRDLILQRAVGALQGGRALPDPRLQLIVRLLQSQVNGRQVPTLRRVCRTCLGDLRG